MLGASLEVSPDRMSEYEKVREYEISCVQKKEGKKFVCVSVMANKRKSKNKPKCLMHVRWATFLQRILQSFCQFQTHLRTFKMGEMFFVKIGFTSAICLIAHH